MVSGIWSKEKDDAQMIAQVDGRKSGRTQEWASGETEHKGRTMYVTARRLTYVMGKNWSHGISPVTSQRGCSGDVCKGTGDVCRCGACAGGGRAGWAVHLNEGCKVLDLHSKPTPHAQYDPSMDSHDEFPSQGAAVAETRDKRGSSLSIGGRKTVRSKEWSYIAAWQA
jgi:hypothetical protein